MIIIPRNLLQAFGVSDRTPTLYFHPVYFLRRLFWERLVQIEKLIKKSIAPQRRNTCLDFGGGGGAFLPALSQLFARCTLVDLEPSQAIVVNDIYRLSNTTIIQMDLKTSNQPNEMFDAIIAADVLEHFEELSHPLIYIKKHLKSGGFLFTSLPRENLLYVFTRLVFRIKKPIDHYHTAKEVETMLKKHGFARQKCLITPGLFSVLILMFFSIKAWKFNH